MARIGGVLANTVGRLAEIHMSIPIVLFGASALISGLLAIMLPETAGTRLPDTIEECEEMAKAKTRRASKASNRRNSSLAK